ncbi:PEP-CTERM sorting domain-containing protein [Rhodoferax sp. U11-2br]|uniref:PEP-CTERM sorting domain-containing protein n=1 Tax=Rhodoferax sp. U11-2br TaxID=2838878 RepID=UPI001BEBA0B1|nr:PEP-CTERM sorting domain-containing protein [Rhodoferax sp. U11-2br]MBT3065986.1 PEP-CTERM sorting domain-containing protein [Rhodoferax sp. U11-2br]
MKKTWIKTIALLCACFLSTSSFALPSFARVVSGEATLFWGANSLTVETKGNTTIEWHSFDLSEVDHVYFNQSNASNWVWNTVFDTGPIQISGTITSNGGWGLTGTEFVINGSLAAPNLTAGSPVSLTGGTLVSGAAIGNGDTASSLLGGEIVFIVAGSGGDIRLPQPSGVIIPSIPEPRSYAILLAGLGLLGAATRCRRQAH